MNRRKHPLFLSEPLPTTLTEIIAFHIVQGSSNPTLPPLLSHFTDEEIGSCRGHVRGPWPYHHVLSEARVGMRTASPTTQSGS